jgi:hypothetical protein
VPPAQPLQAGSSQFTFRVGDKVVAYWQQELKWRHRVVLEVYKDEALIRPAESVGRPNLVPFYLIKQPGTPLEALDLIENTIQELAGEVGDRPLNNSTAPGLTGPREACNLVEVARSAKGSRHLQGLLTSPSGPAFSGRLLSELERDPLGLANHPKACYLDPQHWYKLS